MSKPESGDTVGIQFVAKLADDTVFDSSPPGDFFEFVLGEPGILLELQDVIREMSVGETKSLHLPPEKAFGKYDEGLVYQFPLSSLPEDFEVEKGQQIIYETEQHKMKRVMVKDKDESYLVLDHNHPMAGKDVEYEITLVDVLKSGE